MAEPRLTPELQQQLGQLQQMSQQLQALQQQRMQFEALKSEADDAIEALEALDEDAVVYRDLGSLLVKDAGRDAALARLKDDQETLEVRIKRATSQEAAMKEQAESLQKKLQAAFGQ